MEKDFLWRVEADVTHRAVGPISELFEKFCMAVSLFENNDAPNEWRVEGYTGVAPDKIAVSGEMSRILSDLGEAPLTSLRCELVQPRDWLEVNAKDFQPTLVGRFFIHGSHFDGQAPLGRIPIHLNPGTAFGSGEHGSTKGCLNMIEKISKARRFLRPLDMGSGSGVLSIAMAKTWSVSVVAADVDSEAVCVTTANAKKNGVARRVVSIRSKGYNSRRIKSLGPYDVITANIFMRPLISMAQDLGQNLRQRNKGGGFVVLSGMLETDGRRVLAAHHPYGLRLCDWIVLDGWLTMLLKR